MDTTNKKNMHTFRTDDTLKNFIEKVMQKRNQSKTELICNAIKQQYALDLLENDGRIYS